MQEGKLPCTPHDMVVGDEVIIFVPIEWMRSVML